MPRPSLSALRPVGPTRAALATGTVVRAFASALLAGCTTALGGGARGAPTRPDALPVPAVGPGVTVPAMPPAPEPAAAASDSAGVARLLRLSYVWHLVSLHHPAASVRGIPLDSAYIRAVTLVRSATTAAELDAAYGRFLGVLGDPLTSVESADAGAIAAGTSVSTALERVATERTRDSILVVRMPTASRYEESAVVSLQAALAAPPARVVLDLRAARRADADSVEAFVARTQLVEQLASIPFTRSTVRVRRVGGSRFADGAWRFDDAWLVRDGGLVIPRAATPRRVMVLANANTVLPRAVLGLIASARATLIAEGSVRDDALVPSVRVAIGDGLAVRLRTGELVHADGSSGLVADTTVALSTVAAADSAPAMRAAMTLLRAGRAPRAFRFPVVRAPAQLPGYYDGDPYPFMGARVLAAARIWSAMRARHAHRDLYDDDIDGIFERTIPAVERAGSARAYAAALLSQSASFDDAQVELTGPSADSVRGVASLPFRVRFIDGRALISDVLNDPEVRTLGVERGQEVVAIDGFPLAAWLAEHRRDVSAPNDAARTDLLMRLLPRGPEGAVLLRLRDVNNRERQVTATRRERFVPLLATVERPAQPATQALPNGVAYLDLDRLTEQTVGDALAQHRSARAWMLDLRGALADSSAIGTRVLAAVRTREVAVIGRELHRYQSAPCLVETLREATQQCPDERETRARVSRGDTVAHFAGRLVALVDERTSGAMERLALALEATTDITFIGSATAGSPADAVPVPLPGQLRVQVPAVELRRTDGSPWQRVGISPVVDARLTARTVRSGGDDVIERAQQWVQQQLDGSRRRR